jgi:hypothetical protein
MANTGVSLLYSNQIHTIPFSASSPAATWLNVMAAGRTEGLRQGELLLTLQDNLIGNKKDRELKEKISCCNKPFKSLYKILINK